MITKDIELLNEVFNTVKAGVIGEYDQLEYEVFIGDGYIDTVLVVRLNGVEVDQSNYLINNSLIYKMVKSLKESANGRGEFWKSFMISFKDGGQVKVKFEYGQ
ncbi:immunity protein YezG family protein [Xanthomonas sp. 3058]|uniref:immunity protein YezG family protein n=1 Tax=Xanthomonas sp. 3058 TaxID=3035314 RepID=UPI00161E6C80|nr:immunity protein YezG family protein [Xanthomonas sp. 3058]MBB5866619.1 hypothetical protein [Xanthomonas sp. 3058]